MTFKRRLVMSLLGWFAQRIVRKYQPRIVGITGSIGKTSAKEAVAQVLQGSFTVGKNEKNFNTEIGVPLTILGISHQPHSLFEWGTVIGRALRLLLKRDRKYPTVLVLEMGADHPGDLAQLIRIAPCDVGVVTAVGPAHLEYFETIEVVSKEKSLLVTHLKPQGLAVLNMDDPLVYPMQEKTQARTLTVGFSAKAQLRAIEMKSDIAEDERGIWSAETTFKLYNGNAAVPVRLTGMVGNPPVYASLFAAAAASYFGVNLHTVAERLQGLKPMPGRLSVLPGVRRTLIIDDTYNASPKAVEEALRVLAELAAGRQTWVVLGDMLELGAFTREAHREIGKKVAQKGVSYLVTVGERARDIARAAQEGGLREEYVYVFATTAEAGRFIQNRIAEGDVILVKGSRAMHMEQVVKEIMAEPLRAKELLVHD